MVKKVRGRMVFLATVLSILGLGWAVSAAASGSAPAPALVMDIQTLTSLVLENNFDIKISQLSHNEKRGALVKTKGAFDTNLNYSLTFAERNTPSSSTLDGAGSGASVISREKSQVLTLSKTFKFGTEIILPYTYKLNYSNSIYKQIPETHEPSFAIIIRQPLLKSFTPSYFRKDLEQAELALRESIQVHREKIIKTLKETIDLFFGVVEASSSLTIKEKAMELARENSEFMEKKKTSGKASPVDVLDSASSYRKALEEWEAQKSELANRQDEFKKRIWGDKWDQVLDPGAGELPLHFKLDKLAPVTLHESLEETIRKAWKIRAEGRTQEFSREKARRQRNYSRLDLLPAVDLELQGTSKGLDRNFGKSHQEVFEGDYPTWKAGVKVSRPLMRYAAKGALQMNELKVLHEDLKTREVLRDISFEVQKAVRDLKTDWGRMEALNLISKVEEEKLELMRMNFSMGKISSFELGRHMESKIQAEVKKLQAEISYRKRVFAFYKATGTLLENILGTDFNEDVL